MSAIRAGVDDDIEWILALSARHEVETSPLDASRLSAMVDASYATRVFDDRSGYLIVFDQDGAYDSPNFRWFRERHPRFVYVDRVVISEDVRGCGRGRLFYEDLIERAIADGYGALCCEVNVAPPNPASDAFHARMGFAEVGIGDLGGGKIVRYMIRSLN